MNHILLSPPVAFLVMLLLAWGIMGFAKLLAPVSRPEKGKFHFYACGEDIEMKPLQPNYSGFFSVAFAYSVVHVSALMLLTIPAGAAALLGLAYVLIMLLVIWALVTELKLI